MSKKNKTKIFFATFYTLLILVFTIYLLFNESGLLRYFELQNRVNEINLKISEAEENIKKLNYEIDSLKNSQVKLEQVAREKYDMQRQNEQGFRINNQNEN